MGYYNREMECMDREALRALQSKRLAEVVAHVYDHVPFYRKKMDDAGVKPADIRSIDDIVYLPFTTKTDLRDNYPFGLFAVPQEEIVRIHASSGTTGKPTVAGYTMRDVEDWAEIDARALVCAGQSAKSTIQVSYGYGLFTGGLGMHYGSERLGCSTVPTSSGNTKRQIMLMKDFGATCICCTPSYLLYIAETMLEMGIDPKRDLKLEAAILGAEPWTEEMRSQIEDTLGIKTIDIYGLSEISGPGVSVECEHQCGMHIQEDLFFPEIVHPDTLKPLPDGQKGELCFTTIHKQGMPLLRYRTRDVTSLVAEPCVCGRTTRRMNKVLGRTDDMLIIRGVNVFPSQIESVLVRYEEIAPYYMIYVTRENNTDVIEVKAELSSSLAFSEIRDLENLKRRMAQELQTVLNISVKLTLVEPKSIERFTGKAQRVVDLRGQ